MSSLAEASSAEERADVRLPRITILYCTQCRWMLRAAYVGHKATDVSECWELAQELLSTFSTALGEVALQPGTGGVFVVEITTNDTVNAAVAGAATPSTATSATPLATPATATPEPLNPSSSHPLASASIHHYQHRRQVLWDRKTGGGFPEAKELKRRVRDVVAPGRDLGHVDREYPRGETAAVPPPAPAPAEPAAAPAADPPSHSQQQPPGPRWGSSSSGGGDGTGGPHQHHHPAQLIGRRAGNVVGVMPMVRRPPPGPPGLTSAGGGRPAGQEQGQSSGADTPAEAPAGTEADAQKGTQSDGRAECADCE